MHRTPVAQIAHHGDVEIVDMPDLFLNGVEIQQCLCWMLAPSIAGAFIIFISHSRSGASHSGTRDGPKTKGRPSLPMQSFSRAMASSVSPRKA